VAELTPRQVRRRIPGHRQLWRSIRQDPGMGDRAIAVARQGLSYGVHVMTSATAWFVGQKQGLLNVSNARIQLRLSKP